MLHTLRIQPTGVPIYLQLRDQLLQAIGAGHAAPGDRLPTMREVAVALRIDLNTVRHAYEALARTGAIVIRPARGTFVANPPSVPDAPMRHALLDELAHRTIAAARAAGLDPADLAGRIIDIEQDKGAPR